MIKRKEKNASCFFVGYITVYEEVKVGEVLCVTNQKQGGRPPYVEELRLNQVLGAYSYSKYVVLPHLTLKSCRRCVCVLQQ